MPPQISEKGSDAKSISIFYNSDQAGAERDLDAATSPKAVITSFNQNQ